MHHLSQHTHQSAPETTGRTIHWAKYYDRFVKFLTLGRENNLRAEMIRLASIHPGETILDVGCGTGTLTLLAKTAAGDRGVVHGIDAAPEMIDTAQQKAVRKGQKVDFQVSAIEALPFEDSTMDVVLSSLMFHHLPDDLKVRGLAEVHRVLKPGGHVLIVDMKGETTASRRRSLIEMIHPGANSGTYDLVPLLKQMGYVDVEAGSLSMMQLGFVQGWRSK